MSDPDSLSYAETARAVGLSIERFRKVWKAWARDLAFPPPFKTPCPNGRGTYAWRACAVATWKEGRERAFGQAAPAKPGQERPARRADPRLTRDRAALAQMMERA